MQVEFVVFLGVASWRPFIRGNAMIACVVFYVKAYPTIGPQGSLAKGK